MEPVEISRRMCRLRTDYDVLVGHKALKNIPKQQIMVTHKPVGLSVEPLANHMLYRLVEIKPIAGNPSLDSF